MTLLTKKHEDISEILKGMDEMLEELETSLEDDKPLLNDEQYFTDQEVSQKLKISRRTLQEYRNQGIMSYIQLGGKILYRGSDLQKLLEQNYYPAWRNNNMKD